MNFVLNLISLPVAVLVVGFLLCLRKITVEYSNNESLWMPRWRLRLLVSVVIVRVIDGNVVVVLRNMLVELGIFKILDHLSLLWKIAVESINQEFFFFRLKVCLREYRCADLTRAFIWSFSKSLSIEIDCGRIHFSSNLLPCFVCIQNTYLVFDCVIGYRLWLTGLFVFKHPSLLIALLFGHRLKIAIVMRETQHRRSIRYIFVALFNS